MNKSVSLDDVANCVLHLLSASMFWLVFYCQLQCWVCWQNLTGFLSIHSGEKQWNAIHRNFISISNTKHFNTGL